MLQERKMQKIAKNTATLFARQIILALISLYTTRLVLQRLGILDFGVLNATLSAASVLYFVTGSVGMITQRYLAFAIGEGSTANIKRYYDTCLLMTIAGSIVIFVFLETVGLWFVSKQMTIEADRYDAVMILYQVLILQVIVGTVTSFHSSVILAHEEMHVFTLISTLDALLRLGAALSIVFFTGEALVNYGFLLLGTGFIVMTLQWAYCARRYKECAFGHVNIDFVTLREMGEFTRWTLFGQFTTVCRTQAITLLINQAFNPATVAARVLALMIYTQVQTFSQNFISALNPPIIKAYASRKNEEAFSLIILGSRLAFFLSWIVTLPLAVLLPSILNLWLSTYPGETVLFTRLALLEGLILSISFPLMVAVRAVGDLRAYELTLGSLQLLVLLISWFLVRLGFPAYTVFLVAIAINVIMFAVRLWLTQRLLGLQVMAYVRAVLLPVALVVGISCTMSVALMTAVPSSSILELSLASFAGVGGIVLAAPFCIFVLGLCQAERTALRDIILAKFTKRKISP